MAKSQRSSGCYSLRGNARALARGKVIRQISSLLKGEDGGGMKNGQSARCGLKNKVY